MCVRLWCVFIVIKNHPVDLGAVVMFRPCCNGFVITKKSVHTQSNPSRFCLFQRVHSWMAVESSQQFYPGAECYLQCKRFPEAAFRSGMDPASNNCVVQCKHWNRIAAHLEHSLRLCARGKERDCISSHHSTPRRFICSWYRLFAWWLFIAIRFWALKKKSKMWGCCAHCNPHATAAQWNVASFSNHSLWGI